MWDYSLVTQNPKEQRARDDHIQRKSDAHNCEGKQPAGSDRVPLGLRLARTEVFYIKVEKK